METAIFSARESNRGAGEGKVYTVAAVTRGRKSEFIRRYVAGDELSRWREREKRKRARSLRTSIFIPLTVVKIGIWGKGRKGVTCLRASVHESI